MDRQAGAASGGVVIFVDFQARVASYEPIQRESRIDWLAMAADAEAHALTATTRKQRDALMRCALQFRAKARCV